MRVSTSQIFNNFIKYDNKRQAQLDKFSNRLSSGKRLLRPSTDPIDLAQSLRYKSINKDIEGYLKNIDILKSTQEIAENSLGNIVESGQEVRVELVQLLNTGVLDREDANVIKDFLQGMRDYIVHQANVKIGDHYLFSGTNSQNAPVDQIGNYNGNNLQTIVPIAKGVEEPIRFNGKIALGVIEGGYATPTLTITDPDTPITNSGTLSISQSGGGTPLTVDYQNKSLNDIASEITSSGNIKASVVFHNGKYSLFISPKDNNVTISAISDSGSTFDTSIEKPMTLTHLIDEVNNIIESGDLTKLHQDHFLSTNGEATSLLDAFDKALSTIMSSRSQIGSQMKTVDNIATQHETFKTNYSNLISKLEDTDFAKTISELEKTKVAYEATMASFTQNKDLSLLNYIK